MEEGYLTPEEDQLARLAERDSSTPVVMMNLIKFRDQAEPPAEGMTGAEAYGAYSAAVAPMLERVGGRVLSAVRCEEGVIGPPEPEWDLVVIVEYPSAQAFLEMVSSADYLEAHRLRAAGVADSRLAASTSLMP